jgi:hypothetical protein
MRRWPEALLAAAFALASAALLWSTYLPQYAPPGKVSIANDEFFYPRIILGVIVVTSAWQLFNALRARRGSEPASVAWGIAAAVVGLTGAFVVAMAYVGFVAASCAYVLLVAVVLGYRRIPPLLAVSFLVPFGIWLISVRVLMIPLPAGVVRILGGG